MVNALLRAIGITAVVGLAAGAGALALHARDANGSGPLQAPANASSGQAATAARVPVLVELFTSEGCSSCPPADTLLSKIVSEQPVPNAEVIALGFHVDYWDRLGWRDRFSSERYTLRQNEYAYARRSDDVYTPQVVVDGRGAFVGSNWNAVGKAIADAAASPKLAVKLDSPAAAAKAGQASKPDQPALQIDIAPSAQSSGAPIKGDVLLAITEDGLVSDVQRGENKDKQLTHIAVVRSLDRIGRFDGKTPFTATRPISLDRDWHRDAIKAVVFVQESGTLRVLGVASRRL